MSKQNFFNLVKFSFVFIFCLLLAIPTQAQAEDRFFMGSRAMGMAGANVACVNDTSAQYYNPAAFGFMQRSWGADAHAALGYQLHEDLGELLDDLGDINIDNLSEEGIKTQSELENLVKVADILSRIDNPGNAVVISTNFGGAVQIKRFAIGLWTSFQASAQVANIDTENLGISINLADLNSDIEAVTVEGFDDSTYSISLFTQAQVDQLSAKGLSDIAIEKLDFIARQAGIDPGTIQEAVDILENVVEQAGGVGRDLEDNTTKALLQGFGHYEIPISYGHAVNDTLAIGANFKLMTGRVYGTEVIVFNKDSGDIIKEADENYKETSTFGIDLGILRKFSKFNLGLMLRNINSPKFDGPTVNGRQFDDVTLDPQVTAGVAFIPTQTLTLEADLDLTKAETVLTDYDTQNLAFGLEWDVFRFLALRVGTYKNLAESDIGWVYTAGLGLNLLAARLDLAGAISDKSGEFDGNDIPIETRLCAELSIGF